MRKKKSYDAWKGKCRTSNWKLNEKVRSVRVVNSVKYLDVRFSEVGSLPDDVKMRS